MSKFARVLDQNSEFAPILRPCDHQGCVASGEFRAPKSRYAVNDYYWFCLDHVRAYNRSWDFYHGMDYAEIEAEIRQDAVWHRPTWTMGEKTGGSPFAKAYSNRGQGSPKGAGAGAGESASTDWGFERAEAPQHRSNRRKSLGPEELKAAQFFELTEPFSLQQVKQRYKTLVKLHHPDANGGDKQAEETLKTIIAAYRLLRPHCQPE